MKSFKFFAMAIVAAVAAAGCGGKEEEFSYLTSVDNVKQGIKGTWQDVGEIHATTLVFLDSTYVRIRVAFDASYISISDTANYKVIERSGGYSIECTGISPIYSGDEIVDYRDFTAYQDIRKLTQTDYVYHNGQEIISYKRKK